MSAPARSASAASRRSTTSPGSGTPASRTTGGRRAARRGWSRSARAEGYNITKPKFRGGLVDHFNAGHRAEVPGEPGVLRRRHAAHRVRARRRRRLPREPRALRPGDPPARRHPLHQGVVRGVVPPQLRALQAGAGGVDPLPQGARPGHAGLLPRQRLGGDHRRRARTAGSTLRGVRVPFVSMPNEPESTDPLVLRERYATALGRLLELVRTR